MTNLKGLQKFVTILFLARFVKNHLQALCLELYQKATPELVFHFQIFNIISGKLSLKVVDI